MELQTKTELKGAWWLPDRIQTKVPGTLTFDPTAGLRLDLFGTFQKSKSTAEPPPSFEIVLGVTDSSEHITLVRCVQRGWDLGLSPVPLSVIVPEMMLRGVHIERLDDLMFFKISVRIGHLNEWVGLSGFNIGWPTKTGSTTIEYSFPNGPRAVLENGDAVSVDFYLSGLSWQRHQSKAEIEQRVFLSYTSVNEIPLSQLLERAWCLEQFIALALRRPTHAVETQVYTKAYSRTTQDKMSYLPIELCIRRESPTNDEARLLQEDMLFSVPHIADKFETVFRNWFKLYFDVKDVIDIYIGTMRNGSMYLQHQFLSLSQALEAFHRLKVGGTVRSKEDHRELKRRLEQSVCKGMWAWLQPFIAYSNEPSLKERLLYLCRTHTANMGEIFGDEREFASAVVLNRNYLTHYASGLKQKALRGLDLYILCEKMRSLMAMSLLDMTDFPNSAREQAKSLLINEFKQFVAMNRSIDPST